MHTVTRHGTACTAATRWYSSFSNSHIKFSLAINLRYVDEWLLCYFCVTRYLIIMIPHRWNTFVECVTAHKWTAKQSTAGLTNVIFYFFKSFDGNRDQDSIIRHWFKPRFHARLIRIHPETWNDAICLRAELYGCRVEGLSAVPKSSSFIPEGMWYARRNQKIIP